MKKCWIAIMAAVVFIMFFPQKVQAVAPPVLRVGYGGDIYCCIGSGSEEYQTDTVYIPDQNAYFQILTGWRMLDNQWYYFNPDYGYMYSGGIWPIDGKYYSFAENGMMQTGWVKDVADIGDGLYYITWYYAESSGALATGWRYIGNQWYYFDPDYPYMYCEGIVEINGKEYCFDKSGAMQTGWIKEEWETDGEKYTDWYYANPDGSLVKGWKKVGDKWYYFDPEGGWMWADFSSEINGKLYLFEKSGSLASKAGWIKLSDGWYYANADGTAFTGWKQLNGKWYYMQPDDGRMENEASVINGYLNSFQSNGSWVGKVQTSGWKKIGSNWYYVRSNGTGATGWEKINGKWYYFYTDGEMATGPVYDGSKWYFMQESGAMTNWTGWQKETGEDGVFWYYTDSNGVCRSGWQTIGGKKYYFGDDYPYMFWDGWYEIDGKNYYFNASGEMVMSD